MSNFLSIFLGIVTTISGLITSHSSWTAFQGNLGLQNNLYWDSTNATNYEYVATSQGVFQTVQHLAAGYNFITNGVQTGSVLQVDGLTRSQMFAKTCTSTGGTVAGLNTYYDTCYVRSPLSTTGTILDVSLECGGVPVAFTGSGGFEKALAGRNQNQISSVVPVFAQTKTVGTGAKIQFGSGRILWNPADVFKFQTRTVVPNTTGINCKIFGQIQDKYGS